MTTSGTYAFNPAFVTVATQALLNLGVIGDEESPTAGQFTSCLIAINSLIKEWMASGIHVWTEEEAIIFLQQGQVQYAVGGATNDNVADANSWVLAKISQGAALGASTVTLASAIGIVSGMFFGVVLDTGSTFWTTVNGTPSGSVVTLAAPLPSGASQNQFCFAYTTKIVRPLKIPNARLLYYQGNLETPMTVMSRQEYMDMPDKTTPGTPTQFFYSPQLVQGQLYVWPAPQINGSTGAFGVRVTWYRPLQDFNAPSDTADLPQEWINTLIWCLAKEVGPGFEVTEAKWQRVVKMAEEKLLMVYGWDRESEPILFQLYDERAG